MRDRTMTDQTVENDETSPALLTDIVAADDPLMIEDDEHGQTAFGRVEIHRQSDGTFLAIAHPCTDLTSFAPEAMTDEGAEVWADQIVDVFDEFMLEEYHLDTPQDPSTSFRIDIEVDALEHTATLTLAATVRTDEIIELMHRTHPALKRYDTELADGTTTRKWRQFLAAHQG